MPFKQLRECLAKKRELQKWKNQQLEQRITSETDLASHYEELFVVRQQEDERALSSRIAEYTRQREQWKADREQDRKDHAQEVADLTKLHVRTDSRLSSIPNNSRRTKATAQAAFLVFHGSHWLVALYLLEQEALESRNTQLQAELKKVS